MGVTDLRKLIKDFPGATKIDGEFPYYYVIIDCSNLITTFIMRHLTNLALTSKITFEHYVVTMEKTELIVMSIDDQIETIVRNVVADTVDLIHKCKMWFHDLYQIILVSDPSKEYDYSFIYNDDIKMNNVDIDMFVKWLDINREEVSDTYNISFNSKEEERKIRIRSQECQILHPIHVLKDNEEIETFMEYDFPDVDDPELNRIHHILRHCSYFIKRGNAMKLIPIIQQQLTRTFKDDDMVKYYCSETEADIFIKAYYVNNISDMYTLVISNDTDYSMLFGECELVDVVTLTPFKQSEIRNPYSYWTELFDCRGKRLQELLARLSALLGNDYTCHKRRLVCDPKTVDDWPMLFNVAGRSIEESSPYGKNTNIGKLITSSQCYYDEDRLKEYKKRRYVKAKMFKHIDESVMENAEYFKTYYETLLIYLNFDYYDKYSEMKDTDDVIDVASLVDKYMIDFSNLNSDSCLIERE